MQISAYIIAQIISVRRTYPRFSNPRIAKKVGGISRETVRVTLLRAGLPSKADKMRVCAGCKKWCTPVKRIQKHKRHVRICKRCWQNHRRNKKRARARVWFSVLCQHCWKPMRKRRKEVEEGGGRFCSISCVNAHKSAKKRAFHLIEWEEIWRAHRATGFGNLRLARIFRKTPVATSRILKKMPREMRKAA